APEITVNAPDNSSDDTPTITGTTDAVPGSVISIIVTDSTGNEQTLETTVSPDGSYEVDVIDPLAVGDYTAVAEVTDPSGNTATAEDNGDIDTIAPEITVNAPDNSSDDTPTITGTTDAVPGSVITIVVTDSTGNEQTLETTVNPDGSYEVDVIDPLAEGDYTAVAEVTDPSGNTATAEDNGDIDTIAPTPAVEFEGMGSDGIYNSDEIGADGTVTATVTLAAGTEVGDTLIITDGNGNELFNGLVTQAMLDNGQAIEVAVIDGQTQVDVTAQVIDAAGNASGIATDNQGVDNTDAPTPAVEFAGMGSDGIYNSDEIGADGTVTATVTLNPGTEVGDTLIITDGNGNELFNGLVTQAMLDNGQAIEVAVVDGQTQVDVTAQVIDAGGNASGIATDNQGVDNTDAPTPAVEFAGMGSDGIYNSDEIGADGTVTATVTLNPGTEVGDTLIITDGNGNELFNGLVTQAMLDNGQAIEVAVIDGQTQVDVTAQVIDAAGNASGIATDNQGVDNTDTTNDAISVAEDTVASGNVLSNDESDNTEVTSFTLAGDNTVYTPGSAITVEGGSLLISSTGAYSFTPATDWNGVLPVITYTTVTGETATLTITVGEDNTDTTNDAISVAEDTLASGNVLDNDETDNTEVTSFTLAGDNTVYTPGSAITVEGGSLLISNTGAYSFTPASDWNGVLPVITYTTDTGETATLTINVGEVNDAPVAVDDEINVTEDTAFTSTIELDANDL
ncbi:Ig-like domain-containing protein, partial [Shewanella sp. 6_MG-2023]|uniref:beta strand repeat-containing protein n=1 Tax=Shewanella sp. 6_MG-2023 TaxID=3062660 RepID=UPI0026E3E893